MPILDLKQFTKIDTQNRLTVTGERVTFTALQKDDTAYLYYDFGLDAIGDFELWFDIRNLSHNGAAANLFLAIVSNEVDTPTNLNVVEDEGLAWWTDYVTSDPASERGRVTDFKSEYYDLKAVFMGDGQYDYMRLRRAGAYIYLRGWANADRSTLPRTSLVWKQSMDTQPFRYLIICAATGAAPPNTQSVTGYIENVQFVSGDNNIVDAGPFLPIPPVQWKDTCPAANWQNTPAAAWVPHWHCPIDATVTDGITFSDLPYPVRASLLGVASDGIVFSEDETTALAHFKAEATDGIVWTDATAAAWIETLTDGMEWGDGTLWIRDYDPADIDVQPKGVSFTFKALAVITNFKALKKQFESGAFDLLIPLGIKIHTQETDFKALSIPFDFKAKPKDFNIEV